MTTLPENSWSLEKQRRLMALWAQDHSAAEIAGILGFTRNAILGKIHRLKLAKRTNTVRRCSDRPLAGNIKPAAKAQKVIKEKTVSPKENPARGLLGSEAIFGGNGISLLDASSGRCLWPLEGRASDGNPRCCGVATIGRHPYCAQHSQIAYPDMPKRLLEAA